MTRTRSSISVRTKLAAALLTIQHVNENGELEPVISFEHAKRMSDDQIISLFHFDHHPIPHAHEGPDEAWNLQPLPIVSHRLKTSTIDVPMIAKSKRLARAQAAFVDAAVNKPCGAKRQKTGKWVPGRKLRSGNSFQRKAPALLPHHDKSQGE